jgi:integrase
MADAALSELSQASKAALTNHVIEWAGKPVRSIKKAIQRTAGRAMIEGVTPYVLRHTAAVWMAEGGVPMSEISQYLGHTSTAVTERVYARYSPDHLRRASDAISERLKDTGDVDAAEPDTVNPKGTKTAGTVNTKDQKRPKR